MLCEFYRFDLHETRGLSTRIARLSALSRHRAHTNRSIQGQTTFATVKRAYSAGEEHQSGVRRFRQDDARPYPRRCKPARAASDRGMAHRYELAKKLEKPRPSAADSLREGLAETSR